MPWHDYTSHHVQLYPVMHIIISHCISHYVPIVPHWVRIWIKHIVVPQHSFQYIVSALSPMIFPLQTPFPSAGSLVLGLTIYTFRTLVQGRSRNRLTWVGQKRFDEMDWLKGKLTGNHRFVPWNVGLCRKISLKSIQWFTMEIVVWLVHGRWVFSHALRKSKNM